MSDNKLQTKKSLYVSCIAHDIQIMISIKKSNLALSIFLGLLNFNPILYLLTSEKKIIILEDIRDFWEELFANLHLEVWGTSESAGFAVKSYQLCGVYKGFCEQFHRKLW